MESENGQNFIINLKLMKLIGLFQILCPNSLKMFGFFIFKSIAVIPIIILTISIFFFCLSIYYCLDNFNEIMRYLLLVVAGFTAIGKSYLVIVKSKKIWNCLDLTYINFLSYKNHNKEILQNARQKILTETTIFLFLWLSIIVSWILSPILLKGKYWFATFENKTQRYRYNSLNIIFPVSSEFYDENYLLFFTLETMILLCWGYPMMVSDILTISMFNTILNQLKTIAASYVPLVSIARNNSSSKFFLLNTYLFSMLLGCNLTRIIITLIVFICFYV